MTDFSWHALRDQLARSTYLDPSDDLSSQRGLVATAAAIAERMSDSIRDVSWTPVRILERRLPRATPALPVASSPPAGPGRGALIEQRPLPSLRPPGGIAVEVSF